MTLLSMAEKLPKSWIGSFDKLVNLFDKTLGSWTSASGISLQNQSDSSKTNGDSRISMCKRVYGFDDAVWNAVLALKSRYLRAEDRR